MSPYREKKEKKKKKSPQFIPSDQITKPCFS